jgi:acetyl esterase/lipase
MFVHDRKTKEELTLKTALVLSLVGLISISLNAQTKKVDISGIKKKYLDIPYENVPNSPKLDVYLPDSGEGPFPVIVYIHGGAYMFGDKRDAEVQPALEGLKREYAVVSINYRLAQVAKWPAQIYDCKAAVRWIRGNAKKYGFNSNRIAAWGASAGGQLAALIGTSGDVKSLENLELGYPDESSRVEAVVDWFGPTNFLKMDEQLKESALKSAFDNSGPNSPGSQLMGKNIADFPSLAAEADPDTYVSADDPPFFIQHGLEDNVVPYQGSVELAQNLGKTIGPEKVFLELFPSTNHYGHIFFTQENLDRVFQFLDRFLKR